MKRLLAYMFIVLGLGLTFNVSANVIIEKFIMEFENLDKQFDKLYNGHEEFNYATKSEDFNIEKCNLYLSKIEKQSSTVNKSLALIKKMQKDGIGEQINEDVLTRYLLKLSEYEDQFNKVKNNKFDCNDVKTAKAEPGQTQKGVKKKDLFNLDNIATLLDSSKENQSKLMVNNNIYFCDNRKSSSNKGNDYFISLKKGCRLNNYEYALAKRMSESDYILAVLELNKNTKIDRFFKIRVNQLLTSYKAHGLNTQSIDNILFNSSSKTQIAKAEPSQDDDVLITKTASASHDTKICEKYKNKWKKQTYEYCKSFDYTYSKFYKANSMAGKSYSLDGKIVSEQDNVRYKESDALIRI